MNPMDTRKTLNKQRIVEFAKAQGLDLVGVADIGRFDGAPPRMHPAAILPEAKSVIVVARALPTWVLCAQRIPCSCGPR